MKHSIFYEDLSWFGKLLVRLRIKRKVMSKKALCDLVNNTINLEKIRRTDFDFNQYLKENF